jgi:hypothetical protein
MSRWPERTFKERFEEKFIKDAATGCWLWQAALTRGGYGNFAVKKRGVYQMCRANRVAYKLYNEEIPKGLNVLHTCDTPACVNPDHLFLGTTKDNALDMVDKGRCNWGLGMAKITMAKAKEIRDLYSTGDYTNKSLGDKYGLAPNTISLIVNNLRWKEEG